MIPRYPGYIAKILDGKSANSLARNVKTSMDLSTREISLPNFCQYRFGRNSNLPVNNKFASVSRTMFADNLSTHHYHPSARLKYHQSFAKPNTLLSVRGGVAAARQTIKTASGETITAEQLVQND